MIAAACWHDSNAEQVAKIRRIVEDLGRSIATPAEAREMLGLKGARQDGDLGMNILIESVTPESVPILDAALQQLSTELGDTHRAERSALQAALFGPHAGLPRDASPAAKARTPNGGGPFLPGFLDKPRLRWCLRVGSLGFGRCPRPIPWASACWPMWQIRQPSFGKRGSFGFCLYRQPARAGVLRAIGF